MKNIYQSLKNATYNFFHNEPQGISFSRKSRRSFRWLSLHTRATKSKEE